MPQSYIRSGKINFPSVLFFVIGGKSSCKNLPFVPVTYNDLMWVNLVDNEKMGEKKFGGSHAQGAGTNDEKGSLRSV